MCPALRQPQQASGFAEKVLKTHVSEVGLRSREPATVSRTSRAMKKALVLGGASLCFFPRPWPWHHLHGNQPCGEVPQANRSAGCEPCEPRTPAQSLRARLSPPRESCRAAAWGSAGRGRTETQRPGDLFLPSQQPPLGGKKALSGRTGRHLPGRHRQPGTEQTAGHKAPLCSTTHLITSL